MKDNRGLSLIELVVTIAIMAIVSTGVVISVYSSAGWKAKKAITEMDQVLSETRVQALSKTQAWMELTKSGDDYVLKTSYASDVVLDGRFTITYHTNDGAVTDVAVQDMILSFDRASGAFSGLYTDSTLQTCRYVGAPRRFCNVMRSLLLREAGNGKSGCIRKQENIRWRSSI